MLVLGLYYSNYIARANLKKRISEFWTLKRNRTAHVTTKNLELEFLEPDDYKFRNQEIVYLRVNLEGSDNGLDLESPDKMLAHIILRLQSGLILVDTRGRIEMAEILMDYLEEQLEITIQRLEPSSAMWLSFMRKGRLIRATVSTRYGFREVSGDEKNCWVLLNENPIISAQFIFGYGKKEYHLELNEGFLVVRHRRDPKKLEHVSRVIEETLMDGLCIANNI